MKKNDLLDQYYNSFIEKTNNLLGELSVDDSILLKCYLYSNLLVNGYLSKEELKFNTNSFEAQDVVMGDVNNISSVNLLHDIISNDEKFETIRFPRRKEYISNSQRLVTYDKNGNMGYLNFIIDNNNYFIYDPITLELYKIRQGLFDSVSVYNKNDSKKEAYIYGSDSWYYENKQVLKAIIKRNPIDPYQAKKYFETSLKIIDNNKDKLFKYVDNIKEEKEKICKLHK